MKSRKKLFLGVLLAMAVMLPASVMAGDTGGGGEPGADCPTWYEYTYISTPWMGTVTLECVLPAGRDKTMCEEILFSGTLEQNNGEHAVVFDETVWTSVATSVDVFNSLDGSQLDRLCIQNENYVAVFNSVSDVDYYYMEIMGTHGWTEVDRGNTEAFTFDVILMGLIVKIAGY